jgi:hypothetical protein
MQVAPIGNNMSLLRQALQGRRKKRGAGEKYVPGVRSLVFELKTKTEKR